MSSKDYNTSIPQGFKGVHMPIPQKLFELRPMEELMAIVKSDLRKMDAEGLIDDGTCIKTVMACNDRLGIPIREIRQVCLPVHEYEAKLPINFEKLFFVTALTATNGLTITMRNPFSNNFDRDAIYEADVDRGSLGCEASYGVTIKRTENITVHNSMSFIPLGVSPSSGSHCHSSCPNLRRKGRYDVTIENGNIRTPFRSGELYIMYLANMQDEEGHLLFPFHPLITPYYEWSIVEKVTRDAIFNSDGNYGEMFKLAQLERTKAWLDAHAITNTKEYYDYVEMQRKKELGWYNEYFKYFQ